MRKANKVIADRKKNLPDKYKKVDTSVNGDAELLAEKHKEIDKKLYPLRIDQRTVIYVTKDKLTTEYAERKRESLKLGTIIEKKGGRSKM